MRRACSTPARCSRRCTAAPNSAACMCMPASWRFRIFRDSSRWSSCLPWYRWRDMDDIMVDDAMRAVTGARSTPRLLFIDNIRWSMIILVLSMHACDTYSPFGNWYYVDRQKAGLGTTLFFGVYQSFLQAFFMALLFFIAGHFAAAACDRK